MLKFYSKEIILEHTNIRKGETKLGEIAQTISQWEALKNTPQQYALIGIPEDIGVRANGGKPGTSEAWNACLQSLYNIQNNTFTKPQNLVILGEIDCDAEMLEASRYNPKDPQYHHLLGLLVEQIDTKVSEAIQRIVAAGKTPIVIGGGHNNSYGNLSGTSKALHSTINCINFDAHTDYRTLEHRHSGNGFSYAAEDGFLDNYFIFGLHRNYTSQQVLDKIDADGRVLFNRFETISIRQEKTFSEAMKEAEEHCCNKPFGLEIDLDAVANMGSSAMTPSGFTLEDCRRFTQYFSAKEACAYIHICEGAPNKEAFPGQVGKGLAYLVSDIIGH
ncbi:formimidoylglutamase [Rasiella rasia]|uniref:Formimidoylglutamase n=1 Tax=Rasiella rasia TaxID=2744027 RepID=A0A6G6GJU4_9FLAO|nr:formimidoylglutamase [Rasiella rasia]QIE58822.1 formimidoylglutamase [Rasiella rasia]